MGSSRLPAETAKILPIACVTLQPKHCDHACCVEIGEGFCLFFARQAYQLANGFEARGFENLCEALLQSENQQRMPRDQAHVQANVAAYS